MEGGLESLQWGTDVEWGSGKYTGRVDASGKPHGIGRSIGNLGLSISEGQFKNGWLHGYQRVHYSDGDYWINIFNEGRRVSSKYYDLSDKMYKEYKDGGWIHY